MELKGIDVSKWQGSINFKSVKAEGIDFVIIKAGGSDAGFYEDPMFKINYAGAKAAGLKVGAYYYVGSKFQGTESGIVDAKKFIRILGKRSYEYPVYVDVESTPQKEKSGTTDAVLSFCEYMEGKNYFTGIYGSDVSTFHDRVQAGRLINYTWWVAGYGKEPTHNYSIWQYTSSGQVNGISTRVDRDISKTDFDVIVNKHFNNN